MTKELFYKDTSDKLLPSSNLSIIGSDIESVQYVRDALSIKNRFVPPIDYSDPSQWCFYGLASEYYNNAINYILQQYPYDGSLFDKLEWELSSSYLDKFVFDKLYPRTAGFVNLGLQYATSNVVSSSNGYQLYTTSSYITFRGGPNSASVGMPPKSLSQTFNLSNIYDPSTRRTNNLEISGNIGITLDFFLRKDGYTNAESAKQVIFDVWNSQSYGSSSYGRFRVEIHPGITNESSSFWVELSSGSSGLSYSSSGSIISLGKGLNLLDPSFHQYSITIANTGSQMIATLYTSGSVNDVAITGSSIGQITGTMIGNIGGLITLTSGSNGLLGWGCLSGSLDEMRFWKTKRTSKDIGRYWFTQVGGGTNTNPNNSNLGLYYKFNEGIISTSSFNPYDAKILDYSGRISNGTWVNYIVGSRNTSSAMELSHANSNEFKDPIIYPFHPSVMLLTGALQQSASVYDYTNTANIYSIFPSWITEEDEAKGTGELKKLTQVIASGFDNLHIQTKFLPELKAMTYPTSSFSKPLPFVSRLLENMGLITPDIFGDATGLEAISSRDEYREFDQKLYDVKNKIYQNIYNNLSFIYKSKGTEKSLRNTLRCFGIDDELININIYADNVTYDLKNNYRYTSTTKKYLDFNHTDKFGASVYQITSSLISGSRSYIGSPTNATYHGNTFQLEVIFPKKFPVDSPLFFNTPFTNVSLFGAHTALCTEGNDYAWVTPDVGNFQVSAIKPFIESSDAYFVLSGTNGGVLPVLSSSIFSKVYDNNKWNFNVRIKPQTYPLTDGVSGSSGSVFNVVFSGYNTFQDVVMNSFSVSGNISSSFGGSFMNAPKRFYVGAHRTNFTSSILQYSDIKASSLRVWYDYLSDEEIISHAKDPSNHGRKHPYQNTFITEYGKHFGF